MHLFNSAKTNKQKAIVIFHPHDDLFCNSTMLLLLQKFILNEEKVYLYTHEKPDYLGSITDKINYRQLPLFYPSQPRRPFLFIRKTIIPWLKCFYELTFKVKVNRFIGVDMDGLLSLFKIFPSKNKLFDYVSFEIFFLDEIKNNLFKKLKKMEIKYLQKGINSLLIQDSYRHKLFLKENVGCKIAHTHFVPVSPPKFRAKFNKPLKEYTVEIPENKKSIIYSGCLYKWSGILEILNAMENHWDDDYYLVIHNRDLKIIDSEVIKTIEDYQEKGFPIILVHKEFEQTEYYQFLKQFNAGFATYVPFTTDHHYDGKNFEEIGYASGKFNTFMMLGIPVITTASNSFNALYKNYCFGFIIKDFNEIGKALLFLKNNEERNKKEAQQLFDEILDPELYIDDYVALKLLPKKPDVKVAQMSNYVIALQYAFMTAVI